LKRVSLDETVHGLWNWLIVPPFRVKIVPVGLARFSALQGEKYAWSLHRRLFSRRIFHPRMFDLPHLSTRSSGPISSRFIAVIDRKRLLTPFPPQYEYNNL
jgi:hypothetical protein